MTSSILGGFQQIPENIESINYFMICKNYFHKIRNNITVIFRMITAKLMGKFMKVSSHGFG